MTKFDEVIGIMICTSLYTIGILAIGYWAGAGFPM